MTIQIGIARHLAAEGLVDYSTVGGDNDVFIDTMPQTPDEAVAITGYGGPEAHGRLGYDLPRIQIRVRGGPDPRTSLDRCQNIYDKLHGLSHTTLPDGTYLVDCIGIQSSPQSMGMDGNNRHEHAINYQCEITNDTRSFV